MSYEQSGLLDYMINFYGCYPSTVECSECGEQILEDEINEHTCKPKENE